MESEIFVLGNFCMGRTELEINLEEGPCVFAKLRQAIFDAQDSEIGVKLIYQGRYVVTKMKCRQVKSGDLPKGTEDLFKSPGDSNYASASSSSQSISLKRSLFPSSSQSTPFSSETSNDDGYDGDSHGSGFSIPSFQPPNYNE